MVDGFTPEMAEALKARVRGLPVRTLVTDKAKAVDQACARFAARKGWTL